MNPAVQFLLTLGQALSSITLYGVGHPARVGARDRALNALRAALEGRSSLVYSFLGDVIVCDGAALAEINSWDWSRKFERVGIRRVEFDAKPAPEEAAFDALLTELHRHVHSPEDAGPVSYLAGGMRFGDLDTLESRTRSGLAAGEYDDMGVELVEALTVSRLTEEVNCVRWIHEQTAESSRVPMAEVELVVRSLAVAMQSERGFVLPLLAIRTQDQYTTTHCCNVSMLSMGLAEQVGLSPSDVRAVGIAALLHDIGKVRVSHELLVKPGKLTDSEFAEIKGHTVQGARILGERCRGHALAAIVAYEHHVWDNAKGGYPEFHYARRCHYASRLVHVCDLYDALSTDRPYRSAWPRERTLGMLTEQRGIEVDTDLTDAFVAMINRSNERRLPV